MPLPIHSSVKTENNKLSSDDISYLLLEATYQSDPVETVRICLNDTSVTWAGYTWSPAIFSLSGLSETKDAEIPSVTLTFTDINRVMTPFIDETNGGVGAKIVIYVISSKYLLAYPASAVPELEERMEIIGCSIDGNNRITFKLGAENLLNRRCPKNRYLKNHCRFKFKSTLCGYSGSDSTCDLTLAACRAKTNQARFGGFPGVGMSGFKA